MTEQQFNEVIAWQRATFCEATPISKIAHLFQEIKELVDDIRLGNPNRDLEYADCFFLLYGAAASDGMTWEHICDAIQRKFEINKARKWGEPDESGIVNHKKPF